MAKKTNTHSIDSSIVGFLSTQCVDFLTSASITNKYLEMTPRILRFPDYTLTIFNRLCVGCEIN